MDELLNSKEILAAQEQLDRELKVLLPACGPHNLGFRGGSKTLDLFSRGRGSLYYASIFLDRADTTPRFWNAFGFYNGIPGKVQRIAVEINIPVPSSRQIAAFFARVPASGELVLLHDAKLGGGKEGVCRTGFLDHSNLRLVNVESSASTRQAIVVAKIGAPSLIDDIEVFARAVEAYKASFS